LRKEATAIHDISPDGIIEKSEEFSDCVKKVGSKGSEGENNSSDCIDKVTVLEKKVVQDDLSGERFPNGCHHISRCTSEPECLGEGSLSPGFDMKFASSKCAMEELEHLKSERDNMEVELSRCTQNLEQTNFQLQDTEKLLTELRLQLASCQKSNSLAETQLKCMAESYNTLEMRAYDLDAEVKFLHGKLEALDVELKEEKLKCQNALAQCKDLEEQLQRKKSCSMYASKTVEADEKSQK
ncbi:Filament-like plant protein, partial [Thalictrum thalictroides]